MRKLTVTITWTLILVFVLSVAPGFASSPPAAVQFEVETTFGPDGAPSFGPFTATGPAVDQGLVCPNGDTIDVFGKVSGFQSPKGGLNFQVVKQFTCGDGSGEFFVKLQVRVDWMGDNFNWAITGGTGKYEDLHGTGQGIGLNVIPDGVLDVYTGKVHTD